MAPVHPDVGGGGTGISNIWYNNLVRCTTPNINREGWKQEHAIHTHRDVFYPIKISIGRKSSELQWLNHGECSCLGVCKCESFYEGGTIKCQNCPDDVCESRALASILPYFKG